MEHIPVLRDEVRDFMSLDGDEIVVDGTLGLGGHSSDILRQLTSGHLYAFDQDERNLKIAKQNLEEFAGKVTFFHTNFCHLKSRLQSIGVDSVDRVLLDIGISSPHVDDAERGFSYKQDGPLDMRFDQRNKLTAADVLNAYSPEDLAMIFFQYGEIREARKLARMIVEAREQKPFERTIELTELVERAYPIKRAKKGSKSHPATKVFQAIRIEVNKELDVLRDVMQQAVEILKIGGRIEIISFHSLEDRMVKQFFKDLLRPKAVGEQALYSNFAEPFFEALTKKPIVPSDEEIEANPRSRSSKLRVYKKVRALETTS